MLLNRRHRAATRNAAALILLVGVSTGPLVLPHLDPLGDAACAPGLVSHDAAAHRFTAAGAAHDSHAQHCFTCHWARSFQALVRTAGHVESPAAAPGSLRRCAVQPRHQIAWALVPGRAPPA